MPNMIKIRIYIVVGINMIQLLHTECWYKILVKVLETSAELID